MEKEQLLKGAKAVFESWPEAEKILATTDGQYFLPAAKNHAMNHCRATGAVIMEISRYEVEQPAEGVQLETVVPAEEVQPETVVPAEEVQPVPATGKKKSKS
jgi:hypothetical protein